MAQIKQLFAYQILDSGGRPTIEAKLILDNDREVITSVPCGSFDSKNEALEIRDNDKEHFEGMGVTTAISYINNLIAPKLIGVSPQKQQQIDNWLIKADGTHNKSKIGVNTILTVSQLIARAGAVDLGVPLYKYLNELYKTIAGTELKIEHVPSPIFNMINGGKHANTNMEFQEFQIIPSSSLSFSRAYEIGTTLYHELKRVLMYRNANISVGEEGGLTPNFTTNVDAFEVLMETLPPKNLQAGHDVFFGVDFSSNYFYKDDRYIIKDKPHPLKREEFIDFVIYLMSQYQFLTIEDPIQSEDWEGWKKLGASISEQIYVVGDDLISTNPQRLDKAIKEKACTSFVIKPNQLGTVTEVLQVAHTARSNNFTYIVSNRADETNDDFIADLAVGIQADFVKFGAPVRGERVAKYNRLWYIDKVELKNS
ncbi:phosphopyruvate hydratase [Candidatus Roizmanbacteria bacterium]|nr:phosphopyruvate hydratase [Candidatus Roizmanbacteria bacterium]